jgi:predicted DNA-binding transcriptional regulator AlpA
VSEPLISAQRLSELLGVSVDWIYDQARYHGLPKYERGRVLRFAYGEVLAWMRGDAERTVATVTEIEARRH